MQTHITCSAETLNIVHKNMKCAKNIKCSERQNTKYGEKIQCRQKYLRKTKLII